MSNNVIISALFNGIDVICLKRPMAIIGFSFFFMLFASGLLSYGAIIYVFFAMGIFVAILALVPIKSKTVPIVALLSAMLACVFFCTYSGLIYDKAVSCNGSKLSMTVCITDLPQEKNGNYCYTAEVTDCEKPSLIGTKLRLSSQYPIDAEPYDLIDTSLTLSTAGGSSTSTRLYYKSNGIFLSAYISEDYSVRENPNKPLSFYFFKIRNGISSIISSGMNEDCASVANSIFLGDTSELDSKTETEFRSVGLSHIFCVSGLHVTLVAAMLYKAISIFVRKKLPVYLVTLAGIWFFILLTGCSPSAIRSGVMISVYYIGKLIWKRADSVNSLGFAVLVICILNPFEAGNISLLYSFFATLGILLFPKINIDRLLLRINSHLLRKLVNSAAQSVFISLGAMIFTVPLQVFYFGTATVVSPVANLLSFFAIPAILTFAVLASLAYTILPAISIPFFFICGAFSKYLIFIAELLSKIPFATVNASNTFFKIWIVFTLSLGICMHIFKKSKRTRITSAAVCAVMLCAAVACYSISFKASVKLTVADTGSGAYAMVTDGSKCVVIADSGTKYTAGDISYALKGDAINTTSLILLSGGNTGNFSVTRLSQDINIENLISLGRNDLLYGTDAEHLSFSENGELSCGSLQIRYNRSETDSVAQISFSDYNVVITAGDGDMSGFYGEYPNADIIVNLNTAAIKCNREIKNKSGVFNQGIFSAEGGKLIVKFMRSGVAFSKEESQYDV